MQHEVHKIPVRCGIQQPALWLESRQSMPGTGHNLCQLRQRIHEVEDLHHSSAIEQPCSEILHHLWEIQEGGLQNSQECCKQRNDKLCKTVYLGYEENEQGLAEVAQDACYCNSHSGKIGESVPHKHVRRVPVEEQQS